MSRLGVFVATVAVSLGLSTAAWADCNSNGCTGPIKLLYASPSSNTIYVQPDGSTSALLCTTTNSKYVTMSVDTDVKRATWQLLLAAFLAGKSVFIRLPNSGNCEIQYITVGN